MDLPVLQLFLQTSRSKCMVYGRGKSSKLSYGSVTDEGKLHMCCSQLCVLVPLMPCGLGLVRKLWRNLDRVFRVRAAMEWACICNWRSIFEHCLTKDTPVCVGPWPGNFSLPATVIYLLKRPGPYISVYMSPFSILS